MQAIINKNSLIDELGDLKPMHFYIPQCAYLFDFMTKKYSKNEFFDLALINDFCCENIDSYRGVLKKILEIVPPMIIRDYSAYAKKLKQLWQRRELIKTFNHVQEKIQSITEDDELIEIVEEFNSLFEHIKDPFNDKTVFTCEELVDLEISEIEKISKGESTDRLLSTGFNNLDDIIKGFEPGRLYILAARPGMGKTTLATNFLKNALNSGTGGDVLFFSLEMHPHEILKRDMYGWVGLNRGDRSPEKINPVFLSKLSSIKDFDPSVRFRIIGETGLIVDKLKSYARRFYNKNKIDLIVVDYLQLLKSEKNSKKSLFEQVTEITAKLKGLALENNCPVLVLSQLSRECEKRNDKRPMLSDLRQSGSIEQDADVVMFLYREDYYEMQKKNEISFTELIVAKNRSGPTGTAFLRGDLKNFKFEDADVF